MHLALLLTGICGLANAFINSPSFQNPESVAASYNQASVEKYYGCLAQLKLLVPESHLSKICFTFSSIQDSRLNDITSIVETIADNSDLNIDSVCDFIKDYYNLPIAVPIPTNYSPIQVEGLKVDGLNTISVVNNFLFIHQNAFKSFIALKLETVFLFKIYNTFNNDFKSLFQLKRSNRDFKEFARARYNFSNLNKVYLDFDTGLLEEWMSVVDLFKKYLKDGKQDNDKLIQINNYLINKERD